MKQIQINIRVDEDLKDRLEIAHGGYTGQCLPHNVNISFNKFMIAFIEEYLEMTKDTYGRGM